MKKCDTCDTKYAMHVYNQIALTRIAIKGRNYELLGKFIFKYVPQERRIGCISIDGSESAKMWNTCSLYLLLYELVEILDADELLGIPPRMNRSIFIQG